MGCSCHGSCFMLKPYCSCFRPFGTIYSQDPCRHTPFVTRFICSLFPPKHNHVPDTVRPGDRLCLVYDCFSHPARAIYMYKGLPALGPHRRFPPKETLGVQLRAEGTELSELFLLHQGSWDAWCTPQDPL